MIIRCTWIKKAMLKRFTGWWKNDRDTRGGGSPKTKKEFKVAVQNLFGSGYFTGKIYRHEGEKTPAIGNAKIYKNKNTALKAVERILEKTGFMADVEETE